MMTFKEFQAQRNNPELQQLLVDMQDMCIKDFLDIRSYNYDGFGDFLAISYLLVVMFYYLAHML